MSVENNGANQFENVSGSVEGENELAQQLNQTVPQVNGNVAENSSAESAAGQNNTVAAAGQNNTAAAAGQNNTAAAAGQNNTATVESQGNTAAAAPLAVSGYVMSAKAKNLQDRRKALFKEMQAEYAKVFGDDKKAPKAKMYHAAGLLTIRERDGDEAYAAKLQEYINANRGKYNGKTRKANAPANAPANASTAAPIVRSPVSAAESGKTIIRSIESMASKVKEMVDTMVSTTKTLVKSENPDMAAIAQRVVRFANESTTAKKPRKPRSNKGKTHKHRVSETVNV
jgi:hypothetical protein